LLLDEERDRVGARAGERALELDRSLRDLVLDDLAQSRFRARDLLVAAAAPLLSIPAEHPRPRRSREPPDAERGGERDRRGGERKPGVGVESASEELEVVGEDEETADGGERQDPGVDEEGVADPDRDRARERDAGERDERARADPRRQRAPAQLVERVRRDAE